MAISLRGIVTASLLLRIMMIGFCCCHGGMLVMAVNHQVGGAVGWTVGYNYSSWVSNQTFSAGDALVFAWSGDHDVVEVSEPEYRACINTSSDISYTKSPAEITLSEAGKSYYFICSVDAHCDGGMRLSVITTESSAPASPPDGSSPDSSATAAVLCLFSSLILPPLLLLLLVTVIVPSGC